MKSASRLKPRDNEWLEGTQQFYGRNADAYARATMALSMEDWIRRFSEMLPPCATVGDLGCGGGRDLKEFRRRGFSAIGMDRSEPMVRIAKANSAAPVLLGDLRALPFSSRSFDGLWISASLPHLRRLDIGISLNEAHRTLRRPGILFASVKVGRGQRRDPDGRWFTYFSKRQFSEIVRSAGFAIENLQIATTSGPRTQTAQEWINCIATAI